MRPYHLFILPALLLSAPAFANPSDFLTKAIMGDNSESTLGKLAEKRGASPATRRFGAMLAADHTRSRRQALPLARRYHLPPITAMQAAGQAEQHKLLGLRGVAFDREFARYMIHDHQEDIADFEGELKSGDPVDVRALARITIPVLRKHLRTAESIRS